VIIVASNEFVDLDEIVPGTGFKKQEEPVKKKEVPKETPKEVPKETPILEKKSAEPSIEIYSQDEQEDSPKVQAPEKEKKPETKKKPEKEEITIKEAKPEEKPKTNGSNSKKEKIIPLKIPAKIINSKQDKPKEQETKKPVSKPITQIVTKKNGAKNFKPAKKIEKKESKIVLSSKKNRHEKRSNGKETNWTLIALLILAAIIIGVIAYMAIKFDFTKSEQESVVAVVNGQPIYKSELMNRYNLLKSTMSASITEEQVLNLTITDKLLLQEAARKGISTSSTEVNSLINEIMVQNNIDENALKTDLNAKNISYDYLLEMYKNTLTINKLINESFSNLTLSDEELQAFYDENKDNLRIPDRVQVRHILFLFGNESEQNTYNRAEEVFDMINSNKSNFCELGLKYNEDTGSNGFCGEYNFSIDYPFVPEFLEAGFNMSSGEVRIVKTQIGYHIMYKIANLPEYVPALKDIKEELSPALLKEKTALELNILIANLQDEAIIELYNDTMSTKRFNEISVAKDKMPVVESQEETQEEINVKEEANSEEATVEPTTQQGVTKEILTTPRSQKMILANCLNDKEIRMFTASWSPDSQAQLELFGEYASSLKIVECDPEAVNADLAECSKVLKKQYPTWPTWQIGDTLYEGIQSLNALSKYSECPY
jgi:parvulin-like peptidyl-prolyl isomerase